VTITPEPFIDGFYYFCKNDFKSKAIDSLRVESIIFRWDWVSSVMVLFSFSVGTTSLFLINTWLFDFSLLAWKSNDKCSFDRLCYPVILGLLYLPIFFISSEKESTLTWFVWFYSDCIFPYSSVSKLKVKNSNLHGKNIRSAVLTCLYCLIEPLHVMLAKKKLVICDVWIYKSYKWWDIGKFPVYHFNLAFIQFTFMF